MRILLIGTAHPYRGGLAAFNERLAQELQKLGHEVEIYTFTLQYPKFLFPGKTQYRDEAAPSDLSIYRKISSINPLNWLKVAREIKAKQADRLIFCYWMSFMAPCFGTIARFSKTKQTKNIALIHNMMPHEPSLLDKLLPPYFVKSMDAFVSMADAVKQDIQKLDKKQKPIIVSPHPIYDHYGEQTTKSEACQLLELDDSTNYILFFGFIRHYKGLDLLIDAMADDRLKSKNIKLIVAGEFYEDEETYRQLISKNGLDDKVLLHAKFIPDNEVARYFNAADIVAQPYRSATQSGVTQIAYHFEKPMLVSDVGGLAEIVPHNKVGYVLEPNAKEIADALFDFYENKRANAMKENIKEEKKRFNWSKMADAVISI